MKIDVSQYEVQFASVLTVEAARDHFHEYLKSQFTEEPLLFLLRVTEFKAQVEPKGQVQTVLDIYNTFIKQNAEKELNIQHRDRDYVLQILQSTDQFNKKDNLVVPDTIYDALFTKVFRELREDSGARYVRSKAFHTFVNRMGEEFIQSIAIDNRLKAYQDVILRKEDFSQQSISQKDVDFFVQVLSDSTEWDALNNKGNVFLSKTRYSMVKDYKPQLFKMQGFLDCSAYQALVAGVDPVVIQKVNAAIDKKVEFLDNINSGDYPSILRHSFTDLTIAKFDVYTILTALYESRLGCYILITKSTDAFESKYPRQHRAMKLFHCSAFFEISENRTRYVTVGWMDMGLSKVSRLMENLFFKKLIEMRADATHKGFVTGVTDMRKVNWTPNKFEGGRSLLDTLDEFFKRHPEKDPNKMHEIVVKERSREIEEIEEVDITVECINA